VERLTPAGDALQALLEVYGVKELSLLLDVGSMGVEGWRKGVTEGEVGVA
jgi:hypothetical protein